MEQEFQLLKCYLVVNIK